MGGISTEREISLQTGNQILAALDKDKYIAYAVDTAILAHAKVTPENPCDLNSLLLNPIYGIPDVVFLALHGKGGEDGTIQGLLELAGIPYTGSGVLASSLAMNKAMTKKLLRTENIPTPEDIVCARGADLSSIPGQVERRIGYPVIVKPNSQGSTVGCTRVNSGELLLEAISEAWKYDQLALLEKYIAGVEITVGLLGDENPQVLPIIEIQSAKGFYDYEAKYTQGGSSHIIPARISPKAANLATDYAIRTHQIIGCRGVSRVDMIVREDQPVVLEINTIPGMTPMSLLPDAAKSAGIAFPELLDRILRMALSKTL